MQLFLIKIKKQQNLRQSLIEKKSILNQTFNQKKYENSEKESQVLCFKHFIYFLSCSFYYFLLLTIYQLHKRYHILNTTLVYEFSRSISFKKGVTLYVAVFFVCIFVCGGDFKTWKICSHKYTF